MKNHYIAVSVEENKKYYAYAIKVNISDNLLCKLEIKGIVNANICDTRKDAEKFVMAWNNAYRLNGTYLIDSEPLF